MRILIWGLGLPIAVLLLQIALWRVRRPANDIKALMIMLLGAGVLFLAACLFPSAAEVLHLPQGWPSVLYTVVVGGAVSILYLITYFGLEQKSPSALILMAASQSSGGLSLEQACSLFSDEEFIVERVAGLVSAGQMSMEGENMRLTFKGRMFMEAFILPRRIMGLKHWGG